MIGFISRLPSALPSYTNLTHCYLKHNYLKLYSWENICLSFLNTVSLRSVINIYFYVPATPPAAADLRKTLRLRVAEFARLALFDTEGKGPNGNLLYYNADFIKRGAMLTFKERLTKHEFISV